MSLVIHTGGQTGVDRAALDAALAAGLQVAGWCPKGRRAEDGPIPDHYPLRETPSAAYAQRTAWNVRDTEATLVLVCGPLTGGTALTLAEAHALNKPTLVIDLQTPPPLQEVQTWLLQNQVSVLNVAGPRASEAPGIYRIARTFCSALFDHGPAIQHNLNQDFVY